ncbi:MAG: methyltransferase domain-containing protein [Deltaproteobacteria bacterium]|nr:MAG: methyltransferase domain-containing protein [Deltaproteobacteria bacterium]
MSLASRLLADLPLVTRTERVGALAIELECIEDFEAAVTVFTDRVLGERLSEAVFEDLCPMFGAMWPAARALAERVAATPLDGVPVLELGCGLALPSLAAAARGAAVTATDQHPATEALLARNLARNGLDVHFARFDWRGQAPFADRSFAVVMASDVLYTATMGPLVLDTVDRFLAYGGVAWIADPGRAWLEDFAAMAVARGFAVDMDVLGPEDGAFVLTLRRMAGAVLPP